MNNCDVIYRWFDLLWCQHDEDTIDKLMSEQIKMHGMSPDGPLGREDFRAIFKHFIQQFPDIQIKTSEVFEMDDKVALYAVVTGTHAKTGKAFKMPGCAMARVVNCQIVESWESWGFLSMLVQLGEIPEEKLATILPTP